MKAWRIIILLLVLGFVSAGQYSEKIRLVQPAQAAAPISAHVAPPDPQPVTATANLTSTSVIIITTAGFVPPVLTTTVGAEVSWYNGTNKTRVLQSGPCRQYLPIILKDGSSGATPSSEIPNLPSSPPAKVSSDDFSATLPPGGVFTHTFSLTGTHPYSLATAPQFCGQVIVQAASTPYVSLSATPGSGTVPLTVLYTVSASQLAARY